MSVALVVAPYTTASADEEDGDTITALHAEISADEARYDGSVQWFTDAFHLRAATLSVSADGTFAASEVVAAISTWIIAADECSGGGSSWVCEGDVSLQTATWMAHADRASIDIDALEADLDGEVWTRLAATSILRVAWH